MSLFIGKQVRTTQVISTDDLQIYQIEIFFFFYKLSDIYINVTSDLFH